MTGICCSAAKLCLILCNPMNCSMLGFPVLHHFLEFAQSHAHWVSDAISSSVNPFSSCLQSFPASGSANGSALRIRWPKYLSFSFSISPSNEYSGFIWFIYSRIDWLDLLAVQGTPKSLLQHHRLKASLLRYAIFFMVQFSQEYEFRDNDLIASFCDEGMPLAPSVSPFETSLNQSLTFWCIFTRFSLSVKFL